MARSKQKTEKAYQMNREAAIAKLRQQFSEDLREYDENMQRDEEKRMLEMREKKETKPSSRRQQRTQPLSIDDIFSRLNVEDE